MIRRKHRKYNRVRPHQPPKGTSGKGMRTAPGPPWTKRAPRAMTLEEPPPEAAQEHSQSQPQPEPQEEPKASQTESRDGGQGDRATAMAKTDAAMQNGPTTDELRDSWNDSQEDGQCPARSQAEQRRRQERCGWRGPTEERIPGATRGTVKDRRFVC